MRTIISIFISILAFHLSFGQTVKSIGLFMDAAGRASFSVTGDTIAYHAKDGKTYYDIFITNRNGGNKQCLTCDHPELPNKHIGQPSWHPGGKWIVFQAEMKEHVFPKVGALAAPGIGYHNDIYILNIAAKKVYRLTNLETKMFAGDKTPSSAVLQPHFNSAGTKLSWSERVDDGGDWGKWVIRVADFTIKNSVPVLENIQTFTPGSTPGYYESNDFMQGDSVLVICGNLEPNQAELGLDIYYLNLNTGKTQRLTHTIGTFDECPHPDAGYSKICYLSTEGFPNLDSKQWWNWARGEFWIMDKEGNDKKQLTHFNTPGYLGYTGYRTIPAYVSWSPDGKTLLLGIAIEYKKKRLKDQVWKVELE